MVERAQEFLNRWWSAVALILSVVVAVLGMGVVWGVSMGKLTAIADGQTVLGVSITALATKVDRISTELNDAKLAALMAKVQADHTQTQMDVISQNFLALHQKMLIDRRQYGLPQ